ncbi:YciI family protein [Kitasatospora sp. NPDC004669]|uniref:YciI family protein n=1 Tax=Kitasatospora sp. NPDC004669 TaxID=3154555 RepID=UPI0033A2C192
MRVPFTDGSDAPDDLAHRTQKRRTRRLPGCTYESRLRPTIVASDHIENEGDHRPQVHLQPRKPQGDRPTDHPKTPDSDGGVRVAEHPLDHLPDLRRGDDVHGPRRIALRRLTTAWRGALVPWGDLPAEGRGGGGRCAGLAPLELRLGALLDRFVVPQQGRQADPRVDRPQAAGRSRACPPAAGSAAPRPAPPSGPCPRANSSSPPTSSWPDWAATSPHWPTRCATPCGRASSPRSTRRSRPSSRGRGHRTVRRRPAAQLQRPAGGAGPETPVSDGPHRAGHEHLGGLWVIDVADEAEAVAWARRMPSAPGDLVEVRPVRVT